MIYADTDFFLALIKEDDWLSENAEKFYRDHEDEIWTSEHTLVELMLIAYRNDLNSLKTVTSVEKLVEVRGDYDSVRRAAIHVSENSLTPLDALHVAKAEDDRIISSDKDFDQFDRIELENY